MTTKADNIPAWLDPHNPECRFPDVSRALTEPNGLLAVGGNLAAENLLKAYQQGIFPWYSADQPILWWSPDPRSVLFPKQLRISLSLGKTIGRNMFNVTLDTSFEQVIEACAVSRPQSSGTWITQEIKDAYCQLHELGYAHSVEAWIDGALAGGLYGVAVGRIFFGESMFYRQRDASKVAFVRLVRQLETWGYTLIDCQIASRHLANMGAREISRQEFCSILASDCKLKGQPAPWRFDKTMHCGFIE